MCRQRRRKLRHRRLRDAALPLVKKRFLPSQEWSVGERECVGVFWRGESQANSATAYFVHNSPVHPRDHSCEGRNLTVSCVTIRRFAADSPFPPQTIPAKAGISQCRVSQFADSPPILAFPPQTIPAKAGISINKMRQRRHRIRRFCRLRRLGRLFQRLGKTLRPDGRTLRLEFGDSDDSDGDSVWTESHSV